MDQKVAGDCPLILAGGRWVGFKGVMRAAELILILTFLAAETAGPASHSTVELSLHMGLASEVIPMAWAQQSWVFLMGALLYLCWEFCLALYHILKIGLFGLLVADFLSTLYILDSNPLSYVGLVKVFSHSVICCFVLFTIYLPYRSLSASKVPTY